MAFHPLSRGLFACAVLAILLVACGPNEVGQYSEVKMNWDNPRADAQLEQMRQRALLIQQDH